MKQTFISKLYRVILVVSALAMIGLALPNAVQAATPAIEISAIKADESVTVHVTGLPAGQTFTVRMDTAGNKALNGIVVAETKSGTSGILDATYKIPAELHGKPTIAIRLDSPQGAFVFDWFNNRTLNPSGSGTPVATPSATTSAAKSFGITVIAVEKNKRITVSAVGFPANTNFKVRVGPYYNFGKQQVTTGTVNSGQGGSFKFNVNLPDVVKDVEMVTIRMDSDLKQFSYNAFKNVNTGTVSSDPSTSAPGTPATTPTTTAPAAGACQVTSTEPSKSMGTRYDFDAVWTVKNTGTSDWDPHAVDFKYVSGEKIHKFASTVDLPARVKPGESITLRVDMLAPDKVGSYHTQWALVGDRGTLCSVPLNITVK